MVAKDAPDWERPRLERLLRFDLASTTVDMVAKDAPDCERPRLERFLRPRESCRRRCVVFFLRTETVDDDESSMDDNKSSTEVASLSAKKHSLATKRSLASCLATRSD